jgi:NADH:ubiquinone oxidoreductase subunit K
MGFVTLVILEIYHAHPRPGPHIAPTSMWFGRAVAITVFITAIAAAEGAIGLAIFIPLFHHRGTIDADDANLIA